MHTNELLFEGFSISVKFLLLFLWQPGLKPTTLWSPSQMLGNLTLYKLEIKMADEVMMIDTGKA